ncbi:MAG: hypothetical protein WCG87_09745 [Bacteroidota bacterium]
MQRILLFVFIVCIPNCIQAQSSSQPETKKEKKKHSFYASWGYNAETYTQSNIYVKQSSLNNDYTLVNINARDHQGWNDGVTNKAVSIPQYNYRLGYIFDEEKGYGIELNFDHTKYLIDEPQKVHIKGTLGGRNVDSSFTFVSSNGFYYYLNNGANFFLINFVKRWHLIADKSQNIKIDALGKAGIGPLVPHVQNSLFGQANAQLFQLGGWNTGVEGTIKATFYKYAYIEFCAKLDYARYSGLHVYEGTAHQAFGTFEMIMNLGVNIPGRKK